MPAARGLKSYKQAYSYEKVVDSGPFNGLFPKIYTVALAFSTSTTTLKLMHILPGIL